MSAFYRDRAPRPETTTVVIAGHAVRGPRRIFVLETCPDCRERRGRVEAIGPEGRIAWEGPLACACQGPLCRYCNTERVRLPSSDHIDPVTSEVVHTPWYGALVPCAACRRAGRGPEIVAG